MKPVYIINGFLDAGKTDFFRYTIAQPYFRTKGKTHCVYPVLEKDPSAGEAVPSVISGAANYKDLRLSLEKRTFIKPLYHPSRNKKGCPFH